MFSSWTCPSPRDQEGSDPEPFLDAFYCVLFLSDFRTSGHGAVSVVMPLYSIVILLKIMGATMMQAALTLNDFELIPIYIMAGWTTIRIIRVHRTLPI
jgi:hypothetical protein